MYALGDNLVSTHREPTPIPVRNLIGASVGWLHAGSTVQVGGRIVATEI
jgi:hypothetical protein